MMSNVTNQKHIILSIMNARSVLWIIVLMIIFNDTSGNAYRLYLAIFLIRKLLKYIYHGHKLVCADKISS